MRIIKKFESWNNNIIDHSLFTSGKAKYDPKVSNGVIRYKTGNIRPYYFAEIYKKGDKFVCKVYKKKKDGSEIRLRNKIKKDLKIAHNYVREYLNQKMKRKLKNKDKDNVEKSALTPLPPTNREFKQDLNKDNIQNYNYNQYNSEPIIRRF